MKKSFIIISILLFSTIVFAVGRKLTDLSAPTGGLAGNDLVYILHDPSGTPSDAKETISNILALVPADIYSSGDCTSGACGDGTSDGGTYYRFYDGTSSYNPITGGVRTFTFASALTNAENLIITLGNNDNTVALSSSTGAVVNISGNAATASNASQLETHAASYFQVALTNPLVQTDVDDTPVDDVTTAPVSSNWAYDHVAAADPHTGYILENAYIPKYTPLTAEPSEAVVPIGMSCVADNDTWDPNSYAGTNDYEVFRTGASTWVNIRDMVTGSLLLFTTDFVTDSMVDFGPDAGQVDLADIPGGTAGASAFDFGGATSLELPNGDAIDVDGTGQISLDPDGWLRISNNLVQYGRPLQEYFSWTILSPNDLPDATRDAYPLWVNHSGMTFVITGWYCKSSTDDTTLNLETTDGVGANNATVDAVEIAGNGTGLYYNSDTADITAPNIATGSRLLADFDDTDTPAWVTIDIRGYYLGDVD